MCWANGCSDTVQPKAKALFGSTVVKIHNATSYACRNRYGGAATPISEHALANALDVSEFVLASGERITVLDAWPKAVVAAPPTPLPNPTREPGLNATPRRRRPSADGGEDERPRASQGQRGHHGKSRRPRTRHHRRRWLRPRLRLRSPTRKACS